MRTSAELGAVETGSQVGTPAPSQAGLVTIRKGRPMLLGHLQPWHEPGAVWGGAGPSAQRCDLLSAHPCNGCQFLPTELVPVAGLCGEQIMALPQP